MPENTIPAFETALDFPEIRTLELDVVVSLDRKIVVSHEPWMNPEIMTSPFGLPFTVEDAMVWAFWTKMDLELIQRYDAGKKPHPRFPEQAKIECTKPTLGDAVRAVQFKTAPGRPVFWNIEIKSDPRGYGKFTPQPAEFVQIVMDEVRDLGIENSSTIQSFDPEILRQVRKRGTSAKLALLVENELGLKKNLDGLGFVPQIYSPDHLLVDKKLVKSCHRKGLKIIPWTVNEPQRMRELIALEVDGIITDYPNRIAEALKN